MDIDHVECEPEVATSEQPGRMAAWTKELTVVASAEPIDGGGWRPFWKVFPTSVSDELERRAGKHNLIGDVRGLGLMLGVELVKDRSTKVPAREECAEVFERCKDLGLLIGKGGLWGNTLRIKPPMCITEADAAFMLEVIDEAMSGI